MNAPLRAEPAATPTPKAAASREPIRDAATVIVVDRSRKHAKLLMGKRNPGVRFMPGKYVFPGGRVERGDAHVNIAGAFEAHVERRLEATMRRPSASRTRAFGIAAIRELAEETGLLIGEPGIGGFTVRSDPWKPFADAEVFPSLEGMHFVARAITPPGRPRRFDTRFFAIDAANVAATVADVVSPEAELVELAWVTFKEARALDLPAITQLILGDLEKRLDDGLERDLPTPFYRRGSQSEREMV